MPLIRIVEGSELTPELSLLARDYTKEDDMRLTHQRLESGKAIPEEALTEIENAVQPAVAELEVGQTWETHNVRRPRRSPNPGLRQVEIIAIGETHAEVQNTETGHRTQVRLSSFSGKANKGYRLVHGS